MNYRTFTVLFSVACLGLISAPDGYGQQWSSQMQQMPQQPMQPMQQMSPGPLDGMWMANNGAVSAMFQGNFYVIAANGQAMEGGTFMITGNEMITQTLQGQSAGQQMRYNYQPGPDGKSFTLSMQNGNGSITYQRMGDLPQQQQYQQPTPQPMPQQYPQQMPQQYQQQAPQQYQQQAPQQYPQQMPQQQYPQMQYPQMQQPPQQ